MPEEDFIINLTGALYRVAEVFPEDALTMAIKREAVDVLKNYFLGKCQEAGQGIEALTGLLDVAENLGWAKKENFWVLKENYQKLQKNILENQKGPKLPEQNKKKENNKTFDFAKITNERHKKILKFLQKSSQGQIQDFKEILPEVSKRTLRRDMDQLLKLRIVQRIGDKNNTVYRIKS